MRKRPSAHIALLVALTAGSLLAVLLPGRAAAATPCWKSVLNDWSNGRAIGTYPLHCYRDAIRQPARGPARLLERLRRHRGRPPGADREAQRPRPADQPRLVEQLLRRLVEQGRKTPENADRAPGTELPSRSAYRKAIDNLGTSNADAVPLPLIVLASFGAFLLVLAAAMAATKRVRTIREHQRRGPPPSA